MTFIASAQRSVRSARPVLFAVAAIAAGLCAPALVVAQPAPTPAPAAGGAPQTARTVARSAFVANADANFVQMDANHDGKLTKAEIEDWQRRTIKEQIDARNKATFDKLDANHDGYISRDEFAKAEPQIPAPNATPMLNRMDTNHDGAITQAEFRAVTVDSFNKADTNHDGVLTIDEVRASQQRARAAAPGAPAASSGH